MAVSKCLWAVWEYHFLAIMAAFNVPAQFWLKIAVTSLQDAAMKIWLHHVDDRLEIFPFKACISA